MAVIQWKMRENPIHKDIVNGLGDFSHVRACVQSVLWTQHARKHTHKGPDATELTGNTKSSSEMHVSVCQSIYVKHMCVCEYLVLERSTETFTF